MIRKRFFTLFLLFNLLLSFLAFSPTAQAGVEQEKLLADAYVNSYVCPNCLGVGYFVAQKYYPYGTRSSISYCGICTKRDYYPKHQMCSKCQGSGVLEIASTIVKCPRCSRRAGAAASSTRGAVVCDYCGFTWEGNL